MIYSLKGILTYSEPNLAVIECGGVGYMCQIPLSTYNTLSDIGAQEMLYTHMNVRQDAIDLFGFKTREEVNSFKLVTTVSGVGAKAGLSILSEMTPEDIALAIVAGDSKAFTKCSGIGNKIAARIVLELKDKFKNADIAEVMTGSGKGNISVSPMGGAMGEAAAALMALGYSQSEAASALVSADKSLSVEELIKYGLKALAMK